MISQGNSAYYLYNGHGDVVQLYNGSGTLIREYDYDAFGNEENAYAGDTNPFRYAGQYYDAETGTYYLRARYYDPRVGRFTQRDTHWNVENMLYGDDPFFQMGVAFPNCSAISQNVNLYVFCLNDPIYYCDENGELAFPGQIHNMVVDQVAFENGFYKEQIITYYSGGWGRADLISSYGEVWDVKRNKAFHIKAGEIQVNRYIENKWKNHDVDLSVGGPIQGEACFETLAKLRII